MAMNETSFKPGGRRGGRAKGAKNKRTRAREAVGAGSWEQIESYLIGEGAARLIDCMRELKPGQYVYAYAGLLEYFRPKLSRQAIEGEGLKEITVTMNLHK